MFTEERGQNLRCQVFRGENSGRKEERKRGRWLMPTVPAGDRARIPLSLKLAWSL